MTGDFSLFCYHLQTMASEQRQRSEKEEKKTYRCPVCDRSYASRASVKRHEQDVHYSKYCCDRCSFKSAHRKDLERHYAQHASNLAPIRVHSKTPVTAPIRFSKAPSTQSRSRSRSRSRSPVARRKSPPQCDAATSSQLTRSQRDASDG